MFVILHKAGYHGFQEPLGPKSSAKWSRARYCLDLVVRITYTGDIENLPSIVLVNATSSFNYASRDVV